jgi:hypothetical protein
MCQRPVSPRYDTTRQAWQAIWDSASVKAELQTEPYAPSREIRRTCTPYMPKEGVILEAGSGLSAAVINLRGMGFNVTGLDYTVNALYPSRQHVPSLPLAAGDVVAASIIVNGLSLCALNVRTYSSGMSGKSEMR